jgi:short subunit dehydrogenase-like uncharacterized protein
VTKPALLIYGATGYSGRLLATHAAERGLAPIVAGRSAEKVKELAARLGVEARVASLDDAPALRAMLDGVGCVLHAAGPFSATARQMLDACLAARAHYLDITGEIPVFERCESLSARAREVNVMLLPGVGFDVVPSDCLAAHVAARVPEPHTLRIAIDALGTPTRGTAKTSVEMLGAGCLVRRAGRIVALPPGSLQRDFDFGFGPARCAGAPLADLVTAWHSTHAENIEVFLRAGIGMRSMLRASGPLGPLLRLRAVQRSLQRLVGAMPEGPAERERKELRGHIVAEASAANGETARARLDTPSGYQLTMLAGVEIARRVLEGSAKPGYQTPATAFGADLVLGLDCVRTDE